MKYQGLELFIKREYLRLMIFSCVMILAFILLVWAAHNANVTNLVVVNLVAIAIYIYAIELIAQTRFKQAVLLATFTNLIVITVNTVVFGTATGLHMTIWPLACLFAINMNIGLSTARRVFALSILIFICLQYFVPTHTGLEFYNYSNLVILASGGCLVSLVMTSMKTSISKRRKKLESLANRDRLTRLYNRRYFTTFLNYQLAVSAKENRSFTLAMADVDHFKSVNDIYGHAIGDKVLQSIADCFHRFLARSDVACRWGGEEFFIYLPERKVEHAEKVIQAIASVISDIQINGIKITMSFGLIESDGKESLDHVLKRVDELLYQAKSQGRDNIQTKLL